MFHDLKSGKYIKVGEVQPVSMELNFSDHEEQKAETTRSFEFGSMSARITDYKAMVKLFGFDPWLHEPNNWRKIHGLPMHRGNRNCLPVESEQCSMRREVYEGPFTEITKKSLKAFTIRYCSKCRRSTNHRIKGSKCTDIDIVTTTYKCTACGNIHTDDEPIGM
jgi:hypothetical protein